MVTCCDSRLPSWAEANTPAARTASQNPATRSLCRNTSLDTASMSTFLPPSPVESATLHVESLLIVGSVAWLLMRAETLKGHLDGLLLASLEAGPRHGYAIMQALRAGSGGQFDLPTGTIYPALRRLERAGLVQGAWSATGGRRRRVYELTPAGQRTLAAERGTWREFSAAVTALLAPPPRPATP